jgi:hypothetical protein
MRGGGGRRWWSWVVARMVVVMVPMVGVMAAVMRVYRQNSKLECSENCSERVMACINQTWVRYQSMWEVR